MTRTAFSMIAAAALAAGSTSTALAQQGPSGPVCAERADLVAYLKAQHKERKSAGGSAAGGLVFELFTQPDGGSWTLIATRPDGISCLVAAGEGWEDVGRLHVAARPAGATH